MIEQDFKLVIATTGSQGIHLLTSLFAHGVDPYALDIVTTESTSNTPFLDYLKYLKIEPYVIKNRDEFRDLFNSDKFLNNSHLISFSWRYKFPQDFLEKFMGLPINLHFGALPEYRGCFPIPWALINNEKNCAFTYHVISNEIDLGDVLHSGMVDIKDNDTAFSLFHKVLWAALNDLPLVLKMKICHATAQSGEEQYYPLKLPLDGKISKDFDENLVKRFINAMYFPPHQPAVEDDSQKTVYPEGKVKFYE